MTEADEHEQRLLALEREIIAMRDDMEAAIARAEAAEAELQRLSFAAGNVALDHPDWPPEYARHLAALVARAEAAERRVQELEEALSSARDLRRSE